MRLDMAALRLLIVRPRSVAMAAVCAVLLSGCGASLNNASLGGAGVGVEDAGEPKLGIGNGEKPETAVAIPNGVGSTAGATVASATIVPVKASGGAAVTTAAPNDPTRVAAAKAANGFISASAPGNTSYKIGPHDVVEISVFKVPELSKSAQVSDIGTVNLPLLGEVPAASKTAQELERDLTKRLGAKYLQNPQVTVFVREYNSQRITVEGAVKKPGVYPLRGKTSLLQTIAQAEGFGDTADTTVVIFRQSEKGRSAARFDVSEIRSGTAEDPVLQSGDVVVVSTSALKEGLNSVMKILPLASVFALL